MGHVFGEDGVQRRKSIRHQIRCAATIEPLVDGAELHEAIHVELGDVAHCGVMFSLGQGLETGSTWRLLLTHEGEMVGSAPFVVRYSRVLEGGRFSCGCQFMVEPALMTLLGVEGDEVGIDLPPFFVPVIEEG